MLEQQGVVHHSIENLAGGPSDTSVRLHVCPLCRKSFAKKYDLNRHVKTHTGERPFNCPFCLHTASRNDNLRVHIYTMHRMQLSQDE